MSFGAILYNEHSLSILANSPSVLEVVLQKQEQVVLVARTAKVAFLQLRKIYLIDLTMADGPILTS